MPLDETGKTTQLTPEALFHCIYSYSLVCVSLELSNWAALIDLEQNKLKTENYPVL